MTVRETMTRELITVRSDTPLTAAARLLIEHKITGLPVVDGEGHIVGVLTEMDLIRTLAEPHRAWKTVDELMTPDPVTLPADAPLHDAFDCLMTHAFRRVLIEENGKLVGLISRTDLLPEILAHLVES